MACASHIRVPQVPLSVCAHDSEPFLAIGLAEGGVTLAPVGDVREPESFSVKRTITHKFSGACHATELQPVASNPFLYASTAESTVHIFDTSSNQSSSTKPLHTFTIPTDDENQQNQDATRIATVLKNYDEHTLLAGDDNGGIHLLDTRMKKICASDLQQADYISSISCVNLFDKNAVLATSGDGTLCAYDIRQSGRINLQYATDGMNDDLLSLAILEQNALAITGTLSGALNIYNLRFLDENADADAVAHVDRMHGHPECINSVLPCQGENGVVITASSDGFVRVVDVINKKLVGVLDYSTHQEDDEDDDDDEDEDVGDIEDDEDDEDDGDDDDDSDEAEHDELENGGGGDKGETAKETKTEKKREKRVISKKKRKRLQRWPIESMVAIQGFQVPTFALVAHDRYIRFCDGSALVDDDGDDGDGENEESSRRKSLSYTEEAELTKKPSSSRGKKKKRRGQDGGKSRDRSNAFFNDL